MILRIFSCKYLPLVYLWWSVCSNLLVFIGFFVFLWGYKNILCVLDTSPLSNICYANIFSQSVVYLFIFLAVFFFTFRTIIHFKLIFYMVWGMNPAKLTFFFCIGISTGPAIFVEETILSPLKNLCNFVENNLLTLCVGLFLETLFWSIDLYVCLCANTKFSRNQVVWIIQIFSFIKVDFGCLAFLIFHKNFRISLLLQPKKVKKPGGILIWIALNL